LLFSDLRKKNKNCSKTISKNTSICHFGLWISKRKTNLQTEAATCVEITTTAEIEKPIGRWAALAHQW
jgi:hypothetical protein